MRRKDLIGTVVDSAAMTLLGTRNRRLDPLPLWLNRGS